MRLSENPFYVLGASTRDDRRRLLELADDLSGMADPAKAAAARAVLTNPRQRLAAELRWLPGVSPSRSKSLVEQTSRGLLDSEQIQGLPALAAVNVIISGLECSPDPTAHDLPARLLEVAHTAERIVPENLLIRINEDRQVACVPPVDAERTVASDLEHWRAEVLASLANVLRKRPVDHRIAVLTIAVEKGTSGGTEHGPLLLHELIDLLAVDVREILSEHAQAVRKECEIIRKMQESGLLEREVLRQIDHLVEALDEWDSSAHPFQRSAHARGQEHDESRALALSIRSLAVDLHNKGEFTAAAEHLTQSLHATFSNLSLVADTVTQDLETLASLREEKTKRARERGEWERSIRYEGSYGWPFADKVQVSAEGLRHGRSHIRLEDVNRVRWGATRHSVNGIPTGTSYTIAVSSRTDVIRIECRSEDVFNGVVNSLHKSVLWRLIVELGGRLRDGQQERFGSLTVQDGGVFLSKSRFFKAAEVKYFPWSSILIGSANGAFSMSAAADRAFTGTSSYIADDNTHVLEALVRLLWKNGGDALSSVVFTNPKS